MARGPPKYVIVCFVPSVSLLGVLMVPEAGVAACSMLAANRTNSASAQEERADSFIPLSSLVWRDDFVRMEMAGGRGPERRLRDNRGRPRGAEAFRTDSR